MGNKGVATRDHILDTAFRLAAREGLETVSLAGIAKNAGISKSGLFAHFSSKEYLQIEMLRTGSTLFINRVMLPAFKKPRGILRVRQIFYGWMEWAMDPKLPGGCLMMAAAVELDDREGPVRDYLVTLQKEFLSAIAKSAQLSIQEGHFRRALDVNQFAFEFYGILLSFNHARRLIRDPKAEKRSMDAFERLLHSAQ
jgi:AcrR family transcriptional regulator